MAAKYLQLASILRSELSSVARQGGRLPTEAELSRRYHMSRQTVRHALQILTEEGLISRRQGSGSYLSDPSLRQEACPVVIITASPDAYTFPKLLRDVQDTFSQYNYPTLVFATENKVSREREILQELLSIQISGLLVEPTKSALPTPNDDLYASLTANGVPILFLHGVYSNLQDYPCVSDQNISGGYLLTRRLLQKCHTHIAGIFLSDDIRGLQRYQGMVCALRDRNIPIRDEHIFWYSTEDHIAMVTGKDLSLLEHILQQCGSEVSAIVCCNDELAYLLVRCLLNSGKTVPEDMAVVSFDDSYYSQMGPVSITSLGHGSVRPGQTAAQLLLDRISGKPVRSQQLEWKLAERRSG